ncbi:beta subunit of N-acylethanolamine-hydrolyzing acid amidase-domain-containing protein [Whalleya microplaca]|nr:beta subunit of N-acylethanolamine-hydrolyzing acid amidase-domain-containing protein [Whalleya microplaca]
MPADAIPAYRIDLALPPRQRYLDLVADFGPRMRSLTCLFDELLEAVLPPLPGLRPVVRALARVLLRHVCRDGSGGVEDAEIRGIADAADLPVYLLVALNNLLDCLLGCTSGAVSVTPRKGRKRGVGTGVGGEPTLMHFRTLDWSMDELRDLLVVLDFVDSSSGDPDNVIARSITYAGYVGMLTAVKKNFSVSLNFRPNHDCSSKKLRWHQVLVLLGYRRSISSILRSLILDPVKTRPEGDAVQESKSSSPLEEQARNLALVRTSPCYIILCNGEEAAVIEKDYMTGLVRTSTNFIVQTNHDLEKQHSAGTQHPSSTNALAVRSSALQIEEWLEESSDRRNCLIKKWDRHVKSFRSRMATAARRLAQGTNGDISDSAQASKPSISEDRLRKWMAASPTTNELTHYAAIMDPVQGTIQWLKRGPVQGDIQE